MDIFILFARFIYRIRYKLIFGVGLVLVLTFILTDRLPRVYDVKTTLFTGITSKTAVDDVGGRVDVTSSNNAHDNILNLIKSKTILQKISVSLLAQHLVHGSSDASKENKYISAANYNHLINEMKVPDEVFALVYKPSIDSTINNLMRYKVEDKRNFVYAIFNWKDRYYSNIALSEIKVSRKGISDMIEISYQCEDPGIAVNTLLFLNKELVQNYETLLLASSSSVVGYFEGKLTEAAEKLRLAEDSLVKFNTKHKIINYNEQTKHLAAMNNDFESRYNEIKLDNQSSAALIKALEGKMDIRTKLILENTQFLSALTKVSTLHGQIAEAEIFGQNNTDPESITDYKQRLSQTEDTIKSIVNRIDAYSFSKEGLTITDMVNDWLVQILKHEKSTAELGVMLKRKKEITDQYEMYAPVGPNLNSQERGVRVAEEEYLTILSQLGQARLRHKNVLVDAGTLQVVSPPEFPLLAMPRKRPFYMIAALVGAIILIVGFYLIVELLDRTIRDGHRAKQLTGHRVAGVFPSAKNRKHRGFNGEVSRIAMSYMANILNSYIKQGSPMIVNLLSIEPGEGKSYIAQQLERYWTDHDFTVNYLSYHNDFDVESKKYLQSQQIEDLLSDGQNRNADIFIVEYQPLKSGNVPKTLLNQASVNLLVLNAQRAWMASDKQILEHLKTLINNDSLLIYLNFADRDSTEQYTGQLPPYTFLRKLTTKMLNFGITAKN